MFESEIVGRPLAEVDTPALIVDADALERNKEAAIAATDEENYHRYMKYLKGCQYYFIDESIDVSLVTYLKPGAVA